MLAGFGGQGLLSAGALLAYAGLAEGRQVSWMPSYGPEQRGGTANCSVVISEAVVASPIVVEPTSAVIMNAPSLEKYEPALRPGGVLVVNSSMVGRAPARTDLRVLELPTTEIANELGNLKVATLVAVGALVELTGCLGMEEVVKALAKVLPERAIPVNEQALRRGRSMAREMAKA